MMEGVKIKYEQLAPELKTGDIVLLHGDSKFQDVIDNLTGSPFNHMAMVVLSKDLPGANKMAPILLWESTPYKFTMDQKLHKPKAGPTLVELETRINDELSKGLFFNFVFRRLSKELTPQHFSKLNKTIIKAYPDKFPSEWWFFVKGILGRIFNREGHRPSFFCSELIANTYQKMGLLSKKHPPDYYWPKDFSTKGHLDLLENQSLGENYILEIALKE